MSSSSGWSSFLASHHLIKPSVEPEKKSFPVLDCIQRAEWTGSRCETSLFEAITGTPPLRVSQMQTCPDFKPERISCASFGLYSTQTEGAGGRRIISGLLGLIEFQTYESYETPLSPCWKLMSEYAATRRSAPSGCQDMWTADRFFSQGSRNTLTVLFRIRNYAKLHM